MFLKNGSQHIEEKIDGKKILDEMLTDLPTKKTSLSGPLDTLTTPATPPLGHTPPGTPGSQRKLFKSKVLMIIAYLVFNLIFVIALYVTL